MNTYFYTGPRTWSMVITEIQFLAINVEQKTMQIRVNKFPFKNLALYLIDQRALAKTYTY